jgi:hypothetical protein
MDAGEILLRRGLIDERQLEQLRRAAGEGASDLVEKAVEMGLVEEEAALRALGEEVGLDYVDLTVTRSIFHCLTLFPAS